GTDLAALVGIEGRQEPRAAADGFGAGDVDSAGDDQEPGALVDLMLLQALPSRKVDDDRPPLDLGFQHLGLVRLNIQRRDVPALHRSSRFASSFDLFQWPGGATLSSADHGYRD